MLVRFATLAAGLAAAAAFAPGVLPSFLAGKPAAETAALATPEKPTNVVPGYSRQIALRADRSGHFQVGAVVNGRSIDMMVDTGATVVALTEATARRLGITPARLRFTMSIGTANGVIKAAPVVLSEIRIGTIVIRNVDATVVSGNGLDVNLLGMSFLKRLTRFESGGGQLVLVQ